MSMDSHATVEDIALSTQVEVFVLCLLNGRGPMMPFDVVLRLPEFPYRRVLAAISLLVADERIEILANGSLRTIERRRKIV